MLRIMFDTSVYGKLVLENILIIKLRAKQYTQFKQELTR